MPKLKSKRGAAKRFRKIGSGKKGSGFKFRCSNRNHILTKKSTKRLRGLRGGRLVNDADLGHVHQMLPFA